ncbi:MAG: hypothetical protein A2289_14295 [Deltaproteobacteria bacterium RIFOXYA12_FULL_58_15]|nr:MAG: hypothetical protein A2289_14295 [Deltaproteobacteria bacterium RIFOXYA12_FULL_58_15]
MSLGDDLKKVASTLRQEASRIWGDLDGPHSTALTQLLQPNLGPTPQPLRRVLEPVVAITALAALIGLTGFGMISALAMFCAAGLIYLILTFVFGIELGLDLPVR